MADKHTIHRMFLDESLEGYEPLLDLRQVVLRDFAQPWLDADDHLLDIGCWTGHFLKLCSPLVASARGIDFEIRALNLAKTNDKEMVLINASALALPFESGCFDVVTLWETLEQCFTTWRQIALEHSPC